MYQKPTFNVVEPFNDILLIQMNVAMRNSLQKFIFSFEEIDVDLYSLAEGLADPRTWERSLSQAGFLTERFMNVVTIQLNPAMRKKLRDLLSEAYNDEPELIALGKALESPEECYRIRKQKAQNVVTVQLDPATQQKLRNLLAQAYGNEPELIALERALGPTGIHKHKAQKQYQTVR